MAHVGINFDEMKQVPQMRSDMVSVAFPDEHDDRVPDTCILSILHPDQYWLVVDMDADATSWLIECLQRHRDQMK